MSSKALINADGSEPFKEGFKTGTRWNESYRPGGPFVCNKETQKANDEWQAGFALALKKRGVQL